MPPVTIFSANDDFKTSEEEPEREDNTLTNEPVKFSAEEEILDDI